MKTICLAVVGTAMLTGQAIAAQDIAGVQIGIPFLPQKNLIAKANPGYQLNDIKFSNGKTVGINAIAQKDGRVVDQMVVIHNDAGVVWFIGRAQAPEKGSRIKLDTLLSSLKEKYGQYSDLSLGSGGPSWQFDRQGALFQGSAQSAPCYTGIGAGASTSFGKVPGTSIEVPRNFAPKCGVKISTSVLKDSTDGMVSAFSVQIIDAKLMYDELNAKDTNAETERKKQLESEKAKDNKPKL